MGYNTYTDLYNYCGIVSGAIATSVMDTCSGIADGMITTFGSPTTAVGRYIEAELVQQMIHNRQALTNPVQNGVQLFLKTIKLTAEMRSMILGNYVSTFPSNGYHPYDAESD
jgi:hypothetical protein